MNTWYTADLHLGHTNIIKYCNRPFGSTDDMDSVIINNWNSRVKIGDVVYHVGDFCFKTPEQYIGRLNGKITLIRGSHDKIIENQ
jgi:calcineurin-like phosphoesterase family protein